MIKLTSISKDLVKQIYFKRPQYSVFGLESVMDFINHQNTLDEGATKLLKVIALKEHELLKSDVATLGCVQMLKEGWHNEKLGEISPMASITNKKLLINGFNEVLACCGISTAGEAYKIFKNYLKEAGPGTKIEFSTDNKILEYKVEKISNINLPLITLWSSKNKFEKINVLVFRGFMENSISLKPIFEWIKQKRQQLLILSSGYSEKFVKDITNFSKIENIDIILTSPDPKSDISEFSYFDLCKLLIFCWHRE
jgi:hypothetical protein